jgi:hypothetical protein
LPSFLPAIPILKIALATKFGKMRYTSSRFFTNGIEMGFQVWSGRIYMMPGLFLLGLYAGAQKNIRKIYLKAQHW